MNMIYTIALDTTAFYTFAPLILLAIIIGVAFGISISLFILSSLLRKSNNLGDVLPTVSDYSTDSFGSAFYGRDYGKTKNKIKDL